jgi:alpha-tubulin suppressor-like RCC1 family protein
LSENESVKQIAAGSAHTLVLTSNGRVLAWGSNTEGQLGLGEESEELAYTPQEVYFPAKAAADNGCGLAKVACGSYHSAAVSNDGQLFVFGDGEGGKLGLGHAEGDDEDEVVEAPEEVVVGDGEEVKQQERTFFLSFFSCERSPTVTSMEEGRQRRIFLRLPTICRWQTFFLLRELSLKKKRRESARRRWAASGGGGWPLAAAGGLWRPVALLSFFLLLCLYLLCGDGGGAGIP